MTKLLTAVSAFAIGLAVSATADARTATSGVVAHISTAWDADPAQGSGACAHIQLSDGREFAITGLGTPQSYLAFQTALASWSTGSKMQFWDEGPVVNSACHYGGNNQPLHSIYAPGF